jgi:hypothetical protein
MEWRRRGRVLSETTASHAAAAADDLPKFFIAVGGMVAPRPANVPGYGLRPLSPHPPPSLHILGKKDEMIQPGEGMRFAKLWDGAKVWEHPGKHFVPQNTAACARVAEFLKPFHAC